MDNKPKNRAWVKNAAIIFLAVLLVLTFFSNTIMNRTLPEVSTQYISYGDITAKVRGTGTVTASGSYEVNATQNRTVRAVMVKEGQEVLAGDVLFVMGEGSSEDIEAAQSNLQQLQLSYQRSALSIPTYDYTMEEREIAAAEATLAELQAAEDTAKAELEAHSSVPQAEFEAAQAALTAANETLTKAKAAYAQECADAKARVDNALYSLNGIIDDNTLTPENKETLLREANAELDAANAAYSTLVGTPDPDIAAAQENVDACQQRLDDLLNISGSYASAYKDAQAARLAQENAVFSLKYNLDQTKASNSRSQALSALDLQSIAQDIEKAKQTLSELTGGTENEITAPVNGTVESVLVTAGSLVSKEQTLCVLEVPDMGYTMSFSVTNEQARTLHVGDSASVSNYYWGRQTIATISSIKTDPKNPQTNKLITCDLEGDVNAGSQLTVAIGAKNASYDYVVPNSAVRSDSNGSFVLVITVKSSPLSNRYIAKRVGVEVLASDDSNSAISGDISNGDYVIVTSNLPIENGDQVRMADA